MATPGSTRPPLVIVGPTASGKSSLAVALAQRHPGTEVVSADAMAVYRGMDIGTAKPGPAERSTVPHHLIDVVDPTEDYTAARFAGEVGRVLEAVEAAGHSVVVVGGTGLYVRAVVDGFTMPPHFPEIRAELEASPEATVDLYHRLRDLDPSAAAKILPSNRRRIVRALEVCLGTGQPFSSFGPGVDHYGPTRFALAGLEIDRDALDRRIEERYRRQMADGFLDEVAALVDGGWSRTAAQALGYRELADHLAGACSLDDALEEANRRTRRFARRQQRWFRRDPRITWFPFDAPDLVDRVDDWWEKRPNDSVADLRH
jgi:tRNA dimethylallyltransferase